MGRIFTNCLYPPLGANETNFLKAKDFRNLDKLEKS